jgi:hypothetical protein
MFFSTRVLDDEFKDENMHPTYKTSFHFLYMAFLELSVELTDISEDEDLQEDYMFLEDLGVLKSAAQLVIKFCKK